MPSFRAFCLRTAALYLAWWVITEGDLLGLAPGAAIAVLAGLVSWRLYPPSGFVLHPAGTLLFTVYFLSRSVLAGVDVARRLLSLSLPVNPGYRTVETRLPEGAPRWLLANTLSLMPGTISVQLRGASLELHCLDLDLPIAEDVHATEQKVAGVFGLQKDSAEGAGPWP